MMVPAVFVFAKTYPEQMFVNCSAPSRLCFVHLTHLWRMDVPIPIIWINPLLFLRASGVVLRFIYFFR